MKCLPTTFNFYSFLMNFSSPVPCRTTETVVSRRAKTNEMLTNKFNFHSFLLMNFEFSLFPCCTAETVLSRRAKTNEMLTNKFNFYSFQLMHFSSLISCHTIEEVVSRQRKTNKMLTNSKFSHYYSNFTVKDNL